MLETKKKKLAAWPGNYGRRRQKQQQQQQIPRETGRYKAKMYRRDRERKSN